MGESKYEKKFGIISSQFVRSESSEFFHYQGAAYTVLLRIFREISSETVGHQFVDIGSGKGRAVFVAEYCGFNSLKGIELNESLVKDANANTSRYVYKRKASQIEFISANALEYKYENEKTVYFLFNPFNAEVLGKVLQHIQSSTTQETWFVYMNPLYASVFMENNIPEYKRMMSGFYTEAIIYKLAATSH